MMPFQHFFMVILFLFEILGLRKQDLFYFSFIFEIDWFGEEFLFKSFFWQYEKLTTLTMKIDKSCCWSIGSSLFYLKFYVKANFFIQKMATSNFLVLRVKEPILALGKAQILFFFTEQNFSTKLIQKIIKSFFLVLRWPRS